MTGYVRVDTGNNIADGNVINAADLDNEFDGVQAAFNSSTGHTHDGTSGEGAPITKIGPVQDVVVSISAIYPKTTNTVDLGTSSLKYKDLYLAGNASIAGNTTIGDGSGDTVTVNGTVTSNLIFTDNTYDIGASGATRPRNLYLAGSATVAGNTTLGDASTDTVTVNGYMGVGGAAPSSDRALSVAPTALTGTSQYGGSFQTTATSSATSETVGITARGSTAASAFTVTNSIGFYALNAVKGAGSTITNQHGVYIADQTQGTNNYGITSLVSSGTNNWNIYASGTAQNYFAGSVGVGTSSPATKLDVNGSINIASTQNLQWGSAALAIAGASNTLTFYTSSSERMRIDSSGNLGLRVTPSAWVSSYPSFQIGSQASLSGHSSGSYVWVTSGAYNSNAGWKYIASNAAAQYQQNSGAHIWYTAPSGTADAAVTFTQAMTLDASGRLGIGNTGPNAKLAVTGTAVVSGDSRHVVVISDDTAQAAGTGGGINLYGKYTDAGGYADGPFIKAAKSNSTSGNYSFDLAFGTRANGSTPTERMRIDSSGNLGLGVTPSAWTDYKAFEIGAAGNTLFSTSNEIGIVSNAYWGSSAFKYAASSIATTRYSQTGGQHRWYYAASGTAGNTITFTQAMTLDASGNLGIGTSSPGQKLHVTSTSANQSLFEYTTASLSTPVSSATVRSTGTLSVGAGAGIDFVLREGATDYTGARITTVRTDSSNNQALAFYTGGASAPTEKARIDSSGNLGLGVTPSAWGAIFKAFDASNGSSTTSIASQDNGSAYLVNNAYYNGTNWIYKTSSKAATYMSFSGAGGVSWNQAASGTAGNAITFTQAMTLDASGNLGIGVTSPSSLGKLAVNGTIATGSVITSAGLIYQNSTNLYVENTDNTGTSGNSQIRFRVRTYGTPITAATIDHSGNVGIGTSSPYYKLSVNSSAGINSYNGVSGLGKFVLGDPVDSSGYVGMYRGAAGDPNTAGNDLSLGSYGIITFRNGAASFGSQTERMRIDSSGHLLVGTTAASWAGPGLTVNGNAANAYLTQFINASSTAGSVAFNPRFSNASATTSNFYFIYAVNGGGSAWSLRADGSSTFSSDETLKKNIVDSRGYLEDLCKLRPVKYHWKTQDDNDQEKWLGLIAQEVEQVFPGLVVDDKEKEDGSVTKSVKYSVLPMMMLKAIQEQQAIIESLKARLDAANL